MAGESGSIARVSEASTGPEQGAGTADAETGSGSETGSGTGSGRGTGSETGSGSGTGTGTETGSGSGSSGLAVDRLHALVALSPFVWGAFHLWEQWTLFHGHEAWLERMRATSIGSVARLSELVLGVAPIVLWGLLLARDLVTRRRIPSQGALDDTGVLRALGLLARPAAVVACAALLAHVVHLWAPGLVEGRTLTERLDRLSTTLGLAPALVAHAVALTALAWHLAASVPAALCSLGLAPSAEARRSAALVSVALAASFFVLAAQLVGWVGTGAGTFWPVTIIHTE